MAISGLTSTPLQVSAIQPSVAGSDDALIQELRRVFGEDNNKYSLTDKAKAYRHFLDAVSNPATSDSFRQEAGRFLEKSGAFSSFVKEADKVGQRYSELAKGLYLVDTQAAADKVIGFYDSLEPWQKELPDFYNLRDYWSAAKEIDARLAARVRAGAFKIGDQNPTDPETKALLALFKEVNRGEKFYSSDARGAYLKDVLSTLKQTAPSGLERVDLIDLSDQARAHLGIQ